MPALDLYRAKRDFKKTREPAGRGRRADRSISASGGAFVIHKHAARRLHYDLRLEHDGVLWSWAVTRGPSLDPGDKRLAVHVEDHPIDYASFEGLIPKGQYGGGAVIVWDEGQWKPQDDPAKGMKKGHLRFELVGHKLHGAWNLVRLEPRRGEKRDNWLLIKSKDQAADASRDVLEDEPRSVKSGLTIEDVEKGAPPKAARAAAKKARAGEDKTGRAKTSHAKSRGKKVVRPPDFVTPQLATLKTAPPVGDVWLHEVKFDGYRVQARSDNGDIKLLTRSGLDWTAKFGRAVREAVEKLPCEQALIDGEIVALTEAGVSSFAALQAALSERRTDQLVLFAFDLLHLDGQDLRAEPLLARKERLEAMIGANDGALRYSEHFIEPGDAMLQHACRMGLEGVISKRADAPYASGRSLDWIKAKCTLRQEFVIAGYTPSQAAGRALASLIVGYYEDGKLRPAGRVGTGFSAKSAAALKKKLDRLKTTSSPFTGAAGREKHVVWVRPELVAEVEFRAWTADKILRQASFQGLREDKSAEDIGIERPVDETAVRNNKSKPRAKARGRVSGNVNLSNPDKLLWPEAGLTKQGLLDYYEFAWPRIEPFIVNRPLSLLRAPDGVGKKTFFQKHASPGMAGAIATMKDPEDGEELLYVKDFDGLAGLVQLGVVEIHVWGATIDAIDRPDQLVFDLDPDEGIDIRKVCDAALEVRARLQDLGFASFVKTSGGKGFHVVAPLIPKADWKIARTFAHDFARAMEQSAPKRYTATLSKKARAGRIFIDYLRNGRGATAVAAYSVRAKPTATISTPAPWSALENGIRPDQYRVNAKQIERSLDEESRKAWKNFRQQAKPLAMR